MKLFRMNILSIIDIFLVFNDIKVPTYDDFVDIIKIIDPTH